MSLKKKKYILYLNIIIVLDQVIKKKTKKTLTKLLEFPEKDSPMGFLRNFRGVMLKDLSRA